MCFFLFPLVHLWHSILATRGRDTKPSPDLAELQPTADGLKAVSYVQLQALLVPLSLVSVSEAGATTFEVVALYFELSSQSSINSAYVLEFDPIGEEVVSSVRQRRASYEPLAASRAPR